MTSEPYKRGQVEVALWALRWLGRKPPGGVPSAPPAFRTRIKRLLDIDRAEELPHRDDEDASAPYAFSAAKPGTQGVDVGYTDFDAFCLAVGLELLDTGFKQREIVVLMRSQRKFLEEEFEGIKRLIETHGYLPHRGFWSSKKVPSLPVAKFDRGEFADHRVYALIQRIEITEAFPLLAQPLAKRDKSKRHVPVFTQPKFLHGIVALQKEVHEDMPLHYRTTILLELSQTASGICQSLRETPAVKRGPK